MNDINEKEIVSMNEISEKKIVDVYVPTFDELLLDLLRMVENPTATTVSMIARLEGGESLWHTLF